MHTHMWGVYGVYTYIWGMYGVYTYIWGVCHGMYAYIWRGYIWECMACIRTFGEFVVARMHTYGEATYVGLAKTIYIRCIYGSFGGEFTKYTVIYGVYIRFWPTLYIWGVCTSLPFAKGSDEEVRREEVTALGSGW